MAAKRKKKKKKKKHCLDPADVLAGRVGISALELIRMIHAVNPTARNIPKDEVAGRYRLKSQLQSLLINRFGESLIVEEEPGRPDIAGLRLRHFSEDACHAVVKELDDNARHWIYSHMVHAERQGREDDPSGSDALAEKLRADNANGHLDVYSAGADSSLAELSVEDLLRTGRKAMEEYDYDMCGKCFTRAFELAPDKAEIAATLLEFLVDFMGDYEQAFQLFQSMSVKLKKSIALKELAALALARSGRVDVAAGMLENASTPRAAEVYMLACGAAVDRGDTEKAKQYLQALQQGANDDLLHEIRRLEDDVHGLSIQELEPEVERMLSASRAGDLSQAAVIASEILEKWPENMDARSIRREFAKWKREKEIHRLLAGADRAGSECRYHDEAEFIRQVIRLKGDSDQKELRMRLDNAMHKATETEQERKISHALRLMEQGRNIDALTHYAGFDQDLRKELLSRSGSRFFHVMDRLLGAWENIKPSRAARAVSAFVNAADAVEQGGDMEAEVRRLEPFADILRPLPEAEKFLRKAKEYSLARKRKEALDLLDRAEQYETGGDIMHASDILRKVVPEHLDEREKRRLHDLSVSIAGAEKIRLLVQACEDAQRQENWIEARNIARRLMEAAEPRDRSAWREKEADFADRTIAQWHVHKVDISELPTSYFADFDNISYLLKEKEKIWLLSDGNRLIVKLNYGKWVCVAIFSMRDQQFREAIVFRAPVALTHCDMVVSGDNLYFADTSCRLISLRIDLPEIIQWKDMNGLISPDIAEYVYCFPSSGRIWADMSVFLVGAELMMVINIEKRIVDRRLKMDASPVVLNRHGEILVAYQPYEASFLNIYSTSGRLLGKHRLRLDLQAFTCTMHPNGKDYVIAPFTMQANRLQEIGLMEDREEDEPCMFLETVPSDGSPGSLQEGITAIPGAEGEASHMLVTSFGRGLIFFRCIDSCMTPSERLMAFMPEKDSWKLLYNVGVPEHTACFIDELSENVVLCSMDRNIAHAWKLGKIPPEIAVVNDNVREFGRDILQPSLQLFTCGESEDLAPQAEIFLKELHGDAAALSRLAYSMRREKENPERVIAFIMALKQKSMFKDYIEFEKWFFKRFPRHPYTLIKQAETDVKNERWEEAVSLLEDVDRKRLDDRWHCHICHILGVACLGLNNPENALEFLEEGMALKGGDCELEEMLEFARLSMGEFDPAELPYTWSIFHKVDQLLSEQDWMGVIRFLEHHGLVHQKNIQLLARLARAWLNVGASEGTPAWLCKVMTLAHFCELCGSRFRGETIMLPVFIHVWSESELLDLAKEAELVLNA